MPEGDYGRSQAENATTVSVEPTISESDKIEPVVANSAVRQVHVSGTIDTGCQKSQVVTADEI